MRFTAVALAGLAGLAAVDALATISTKGTKLFTSDGKQFFVKGAFAFSSLPLRHLLNMFQGSPTSSSPMTPSSTTRSAPSTPIS